MFETLNKSKKLKKAKKLFAEACDSDSRWQREAREDFNFRDGNQWTAEEKKILEEELRPCLTFNLTKSSVDLVMGLNEDQRVKYKCTPVDPTDDFLCEVLNDIYNWVYEDGDFELEEDNAFESSTICGRGFVGIDFMPDPKRFGELIMTEVDIPVHEVHVDPAAKRSDHKDAGYIFWDKWLNEEDFRQRYPKVTNKKIKELMEKIDFIGAEYLPDTPSEIFEEDLELEADTSDYEKLLDMEYYDKAKKMIRVVHMEYWETFKRYFTFHPETDETIEFQYKEMKDLRKVYKEKYDVDFEYEILVDKKVKWLQFTGNDILFDDDSPLPYDGFSVVPVYAFKDVSKRTNNHFGIVRLMKDPQKEVNKRWSQLLNLLNTQVQPGLYAETDAFVNKNQAETSVREPGSITWLNSGAISQGKFKERDLPQFPAAPMAIEEHAQNLLRKITGINPDLLGMDRGRQEPGVVVRLRQQQGLILLKPLFKSFNLMKKGIFQRQIAVITEYMPTEQIMRILGQTNRYQIDNETGKIVDKEKQLIANIRDLKNLKYNIQPEESPGSMSKRMLELTALMEMQGQGFPVDPRVVINKMDLPASEKKDWIAYIDNQQQAAQQAEEEERKTEQVFKAKELQLKDKGQKMDFMVDMAKINQMSEKDKDKLLTTMLQLAGSNQEAALEFIAELMKVKAIENKGGSDGKT